MGKPRRQVNGNVFSPSELLPVGSFHHAYVSHIEDGPYAFSVQLMPSGDTGLDKLYRRLKSSVLTPNTKPLLPGCAVLTRGRRESKFRRSIVMDSKRNSCLVYHLDYGSTEEVPFSNIFYLPTWAAYKSAKALRFCLSEISSLEITDYDKMCFHNLLGKEVVIRITPQEMSGPLLQYCDMFYKCQNAKDILLSHKGPLKYTYQYLQRENIEVEVIVSHVVSTSSFFVQLTEQLETIVIINDAVTSYSKCITHLQDLLSLKIGTPVAAHFESDIWCRALVVHVERDIAEVLFVDFGDTKKVAAGDICLISEELVSSWNAQAIECCLNGFENVRDEENEQFKSIMEKSLRKKVFMAMTPLCILPDNRLLVELVDKFGGKMSLKLKQIKSSTNFPNDSTEMNEPRKRYELPKAATAHTLSQNIFQPDKKKNFNFFVRPSVRQLQSLQRTAGSDSFLDVKKTTEFKTPTTFGLQPFYRLEEKHMNFKFSDSSPSFSLDSSYDEGFGGKNFFTITPQEIAIPNDQEKVIKGIESVLTLSSSNACTESSFSSCSTGDDRLSFEGRDVFCKGKVSGDDCLGNSKQCSTTSISQHLLNEPLKSCGTNNEIPQFRKDKNGNECLVETDKIANRVDKRLTKGESAFTGTLNSHKNGSEGSKVNSFSQEISSESSILDSSKVSSSGSATNSHKKAKKNKIKKEEDALVGYPLPKITLNAELQVFVSSIMNPHYFYVQEVGCEPYLDQIRAAIDNLGQVLKPVREDFLAPGVPVLARFSEDKALYRGTVKKLFPPQGAHILFVDYGNFEVVTTEDLYFVPPEILSKRPLALRCTLLNINPSNGKWPEEKGAFDEYLISEESLKMTVSSAKLIDGEVVVSAELTGPDGVPISHKLVESGIAVPKESIKYTC